MVNHNIFCRTVKWREGPAYLQQYYYAAGWFFYNEKREPVGPFKAKILAIIAWQRYLHERRLVNEI